jgi:peptidoglycan hydrolase CwlO-like protein
MKKNLLWKFFSVIFIIYLFFPVDIEAITQEDCEMRAEKNELDLLNEDDLKECNNFFSQSQQAKTSQRLTLEAELNRLNKAILIASTNILVTTKEIGNLEEEIDSLTSKIGRLDLSLDQLSEILAVRIAETYKKGKVDFVSLFLSSQNFSDFVSRFKYLRVVQLHDRSLMIQMETARTNFEDQKALKEEKQKELELAKKKLESQKVILAQQKSIKDNLLTVTRNDEQRYQQLQAKVQAQLAAFRKYVTSQGGSTILSGQTKCDDWGCYYNQRDSQWGNMSLGGTGYLMKDSGCFITSVAMLASHAGKNIEPDDIAQLPGVITSIGYLKWSFSVNNINVSISSASRSELDQRLAGGPVIAGLYSGPDHFIVVKGKSGDDYIMNDPFLENGSNRLLSEKYSLADITSLRLVSF